VKGIKLERKYEKIIKGYKNGIRKRFKNTLKKDKILERKVLNHYNCIKLYGIKAK
jgi:hypothetical protein